VIHDPDGATVVISPHLDDAVLSCFGTLESPGPPVVVVNLFCGVPPPGTLNLWDRVCGYTDSTEIAERRLHEDYAVVASLPRVSAFYNARLDSLNRAVVDDADPGLHEVVADISHAVAALADDRVARIVAPLAGSDRPNVDHVLARDAARALAWAVPVYLYADFPHVCKARGCWPVELLAVGADEGEGERDERLLRAVDPVGASPRWVRRLPREVPELDPLWEGNVHVLDDDQLTRKLLTASLYQTQYGALDRRLRTKGLVSNRDLAGIEVVLPLARPSSGREIVAAAARNHA